MKYPLILLVLGVLFFLAALPHIDCQVNETALDLSKLNLNEKLYFRGTRQRGILSCLLSSISSYLMDFQ